MSRGTYGRTSQKDIAQDARRLKPFMAASGGDTYRVRVSANDTTPNYLEEKLVSADTSVVITATNDGADEDLDLSVAVYVAAEIADHAADPDAHHNQVHVLADTTGLGPDHTTSGLTAGQVLRATGATTAAFASLQATDLPAHVLATNLALGSQHTISGAATGQVLRASSDTEANFQALGHSDLSGVTANQHHNQSHVLATTSALGPDHTVSGLTNGQVLRATGATTAAFGALQAADLPAHVLATNLALGSQHTISGATAGHVLRASSATAAAFAQLQHGDLGGVGSDDHHAQVHELASTSGLGADHTVTGLTARQVLIATGATAALFRALVAADLPTGQSISVSSANGGDGHAIDTTIAAAMLFSLLKRLPGLAAMYPMSHTPSDQLTDVVGGYHLANNNTAVFDADTSYRNYVTLNGTNQYFSIADASFTEISGTETYIASARRGLTIMAAVRFDSAATPATPEFICAKRGGLTAERGFGLQRNGDGTLGGTVHNGTTENAVNTSQTLGASTWGFVCFRYDPSTSVEIRLDNNADASNTTSIISGIQNNSEPFTVGARSNGAGGGTFFAGADIGWLVVCRQVLQDEWVDLVQALSDKVY